MCIRVFILLCTAGLFTAFASADQPAGLQALEIDDFRDATRQCMDDGACDTLDALAAGITDEAAADILHTWASWAARPDRTARKRHLDRALTPLADTRPTPASRFMFSMRYDRAMEAGEFGRAYETASEAADHLKSPEGMAPNKDWAEARLAELVSDVARGNLRRPRLLMAHHAGMLWRDQAASRNEAGEAPDWIGPMFFEAVAWTDAIRSYGLASGKRRLASDEDVARIFESYGLSARGLPPFYLVRDDVPFCGGRLQAAENFEYPDLAAIRGQSGNVLIGYDLVAGQPVNVHVVAAVPSPANPVAFKDGDTTLLTDTAIDMIATATWVHDHEPSDGACHLDGVGLSDLISFSFGNSLD